MWNGLLALVTLMLYSVAVAALVLMALFYTRSEGCMYNKVLIGVNGGLCLFVSLVAISPCVQNRESTDLFSSGVSGAATVVCLEAWAVFWAESFMIVQSWGCSCPCPFVYTVKCCCWSSAELLKLQRHFGCAIGQSYCKEGSCAGGC